MNTNTWRTALFAIFFAAAPWACAQEKDGADDWQPSEYALSNAFGPTPLPDRVVLTWIDDPASTQSVTWRTDTTVMRGVGEIALADPNGWSMATTRVPAQTQVFQSDDNVAHYHTLTFRGLKPDTLYAYRVGDGVNWTEFFHFRTATDRPAPFRFMYFGDAQNDVRTHGSRVFREAFRDAPQAAFMLHAGDLINVDNRDVEWGEWHGAPGWVNGTIPIIATPGNHEYYLAYLGPESERLWNTKDAAPIPVEVDIERKESLRGATSFRIEVTFADGATAQLRLDESGKISRVDPLISERTGFSTSELIGTRFRAPPLEDQPRGPGTPTLSAHSRPQFAFPQQDVPPGLEETVYYTDYQGVRIISLDSNTDREGYRINKGTIGCRYPR